MQVSSDLLGPVARAALARARSMPLSYGVRMYLTPNDQPRLLVVLGEAHVKLATASAVGKAVVEAFDLRGVETFQKKRVAAGRLLGLFIHIPRLILRTLSFGLVKDSTIVDAKAIASGHTCELEDGPMIPLSLHAASLYLTVFFALMTVQLLLTVVGVPVSAVTFAAVLFQLHFLALIPALALHRFEWSWVIHPLVGIVSTRDRLMAEGTIRMLHAHPGVPRAVVVMGRAHIPGFERELVGKYRFVRMTAD